MGQSTAEMKAWKRVERSMEELDSTFRIIHGQALIPGHYYKGAEGVVVKVVKRTPSGKTVYITTHSDEEDACLQTKRVKLDDCGNEYIAYKNNHYVVGSWNETDREAFRRYINANIGKPCAVI